MWSMAAVQYHKDIICKQGNLFPLLHLPLDFQLHHKDVIIKPESGHWFSLSGALLLTEET